ncbi:MAG: 4,5-dihydroxyphthalate decarboxylase [Actinomycetia bacterium]|nr:4,5-dihydroxyphthalate decarboxylase [Actinomycetes bacterium]
MTARRLRMGSLKYDQFTGITEGRVRIPGAEIEHTVATIATDIFEPMMKRQEFDIAELGFTYYLRSLDLDDPPFIALPVFPARAFRHSAIYINTNSDIHGPEDLAGKTIGEFVTYGHDGGVWAKGFLADEFGVTPNQSRWITGGLDRPMPPLDYIPFLHPDDVEVTPAGPGVDLGSLLECGQIDALISGNVPLPMRDGSPHVDRLFPNFKHVERDWFTRTGIFPIAHVMVVKRTLLADDPDLVHRLYNGFVASKALARQGQELGRITNFVDLMIPWINDLVQDNQRVCDQDWWAYGIGANRHTIDTFLRYHFEQGLSRRRWTDAEIFAPELLRT